MECNKDEAGRAKEIAERKFTERDYAGAKRFMLKAQNLYPGLEGLSQLLTTVDVYISGETKINGEVDWYGVLGVHPGADDDTVRKQYRKLALMLHPDKNKSLGADGAFKLVSEAWSLLSDKAKRLAYNQRRNLGSVQQKVPFHSRGTSVPPGAHGYRGATSASSSYPRSQSKNTRAGPPPTTSHQKSDTFWTICNRCKTHYEYQRVYLNHTLLCPNCHEAFYALERLPPPNVLKSSNSSSRPQDQREKVGVFNSNDRSNLQWGPFSKTAGFGGSVPNSAAAEAANVVQKASERVKREQEAQHKKMDGSFKLDAKRRRTDDIHLNGHVADIKTHSGLGKAGASFGSAPGSNMYGFLNQYSKAGSQKEVSLFELRKLLLNKARSDLQRKLDKWNTVTENKSLEKEKNANERANKKRNITVNVDKVDVQNNGNSVNSIKGHQYGNNSGVGSDSAADKEDVEPISINVPDPDFHNFDSDRTEVSFADEQIWAAYDDDDGMPRFYARIHKVISLKPFKMRISWLNSRSNSEFGPIDWIGSGFYKTCGDFRIGRHEITESLNSFSHRVNWAKGTRGSIRIYPSKGDIWALYKNWSPEWNTKTPDEVIHKYDMVEVLDDYNEEGVSVTPLVKVAGFRTVFHRHMDPKEVRRIPKKEMFRFSHQVPTYLLTGQEAQNAPKGCWELDPAATPIELLQVEPQAKESSIKENGVKIKETSHASKETKVLGAAAGHLEGKTVESAENDTERKDDETMVCLHSRCNEVD